MKDEDNNLKNEKAEKHKARRFSLDKGKVLLILAPVILVGMIGAIVSALWYVRQCNVNYQQVIGCIGNNEITMYGEYDGQIVEISYENRHPIGNTITEKMVTFTSADKMPAETPVIIRFDDILEMDIYPTKSKDLFVKHVTDKKIKYYYIKDACDFSYLKKMVSFEGWCVPNIIVE
jgi:hypothetical protein